MPGMNSGLSDTNPVLVAAFKAAYRLRNPGADVDKLTDADLLREAKEVARWGVAPDLVVTGNG